MDLYHTIDKNILKDAYALCKEINFCRNINDGIHLKVAEQYCNKLVTFDKDFKKFLNRTTIEIEILEGS
ncbi:MAG: PIN domain-containing protein [Candidatus Aminicenantes bacterium]|nr:MAG: PIN domain-containing protein [Candidatus Aminicenantes bacterium]